MNYELKLAQWRKRLRCLIFQTHIEPINKYSNPVVLLKP